MLENQGFILSRQWRDTRHGVELDFWVSTEQGPVQLLFERQQVVFFLARSSALEAQELLLNYGGWNKKEIAMRDFSQQPIDAYYFNSQRTLREVRDLLLAKGFSPLESDINPYDRFLMERFIRGSIRFRDQGKPDASDDGPSHNSFAEQKNWKNSFRNDSRNYSQVKKNEQLKNPVKKLSSPEVTNSDYHPRFKVLSLDIETAMTGLSLYSIGVYGNSTNNNNKNDCSGSEFSKVFIVGESPLTKNVEVFKNEKQLVIAFLDWLAQYDPDIIIGWNIINFDMWFLQRICDKYHLPLRIGRGRSNAHWRMVDEDRERRAINIPGRIVLDGIELLKAAAYRFESFSLNNVAKELLNEEKLLVGDDRGGKITELFLSNKQLLVDYNIQDCKLVVDIFEKTQLLEFAIARSQLTGLSLDRIGGSVASFDFRYLPLLHRQGYIAPNSHLQLEMEHSPGGFVMNSTPGIFDHVLVLDFKSLYPSIIRTFKIDPLGMAIGLTQELNQTELVPGFKGAWFAKDKSLLPEIIADLWVSRDLAKSKNDDALSQAIKILMNSFYGVLGAGGCRFFDSRLASSITLRGHQIIQETAAYIEKESLLSGQCSVIYGDTDSVFVWLKNVSCDEQALTSGTLLSEQLNQWWSERIKKEYNLDSSLEIEFETHYQRFLMPTVRGSDQGSKKRYAGVIEKNGKQELIFKGLESVRTDWTRLARDFQSELYRRVFFNEPYRDYIKEVVKRVYNGDSDDKLKYRKRLRRKLEDYQKNIPPHVQAARKAAKLEGVKVLSGDWIEYIITVNGAEPVIDQHSMIDYQHYIDRQLAPVADGILYFLDDSLASITDQQLGLFG